MGQNEAPYINGLYRQAQRSPGFPCGHAALLPMRPITPEVYVRGFANISPSPVRLRLLGEIAILCIALVSAMTSRTVSKCVHTGSLFYKELIVSSLNSSESAVIYPARTLRGLIDQRRRY